MSIAVILATFGDRLVWDRFAQRAQQSVEAQTDQPNEFHRVHADELHIARNRGAMASLADWLIFLDADDLLSPGYVAAMRATIETHPQAQIHVPYIEKLRNGQVFHRGRLKQAGPSILEVNHLPIGAMVRRDLFLEVGGFDDWPILEDWHFWMKCEASGARWAWCPEAVYRINWRDGSRNKDIPLRVVTLEKIRQSVLALPYAKRSDLEDRNNRSCMDHHRNALRLTQ